MRALILVAATAALAACAPSTPTPDTGVPNAWRCDAEDAASLVGSHIGAVTFPPDANVRIACTTCPLTRDYRPDRLTILFDEDTGIIQSVRCV